jgi:hypothetical protein
MRVGIAFLLISVFAYATPAQDSASSQPARSVKPLAVASIHVDKHTFKSAEKIEVMILLEAGLAAFTSRSRGDSLAAGYLASQ